MRWELNIYFLHVDFPKLTVNILYAHLPHIRDKYYFLASLEQMSILYMKRASQNQTTRYPKKARTK